MARMSVHRHLLGRHLPRRFVWQPLALRLGGRLVGALPLPVAYTGARLVGTALALVPSARRRALRANLAVVYGTQERDPRVRRDTRRAFQHAMMNYVDMLRLCRPDAAERVRRVRVEDWGPLLEAARGGKGVILVSAHLGNMDTVSQVLPLHGFEAFIPVEPMQPPELQAFFTAQRSALGMHLEPIGPDTVRKMVAHLRRNGVVVIVSDRDLQGTGQQVTFFNRTVALPTAAVLLGLRTGAPVLGAFGYRHADGSLSGRLTGELALRTSGASLRADLQAGMQAVALLLEREIRRDPGQWVVQQPVFGP